jgi:hypothetical protein
MPLDIAMQNAQLKKSQLMSTVHYFVLELLL